MIHAVLPRAVLRNREKLEPTENEPIELEYEPPQCGMSMRERENEGEGQEEIYFYV